MAVDTFYIVADADDGQEGATTWDDRDNPYGAAAYFQIKDTPGTTIYGGVRFTSVTVAQGATINSAKITLRRTGGAGTVDSVTIYGDDVDNAPAWSDSSRPSSGFTNTTASGVNNSPPGADDTSFDITIDSGS